MKQIQRRKAKGRVAKSVLRLPDLEVAKSAVLNSLSCPDAQRGYRHAIDEFVDWYCSEPGLSFSKTVVVRYRMHLESRHVAPGTINLRLGAGSPFGVRGRIRAAFSEGAAERKIRGALLSLMAAKDQVGWATR